MGPKRQMTAPSLNELLMALIVSWSRDTCGLPEQWTPDNPAFRQCSVSALVIQDYLGGKIQRFVVVDAGLDLRHVANVLPGGILLDATASQFTTIPPYIPRSNESRADALAWRDTERRYTILSARVHKLLIGSL
jgi:hypothetical protein